MSRFGDGLRIIPRTAWIFGVSLYLGFAILALTVFIPGDKEMKFWPIWGKFLFAFGVFIILAVWILLIGYVYADSKRRGMRYVMWTWLATLIPDGIGIILYFILRDPLPRPCPGCSAVVKAGFTFCPHCGAALQPTCPHCGKGVDPSWSHCPNCGTPAPPQARRLP